MLIPKKLTRFVFVFIVYTVMVAVGILGTLFTIAAITLAVIGIKK